MGVMKTAIVSAAAGTIVAVAAPGSGKAIALHGFIIGQSADGTVKFQDDAGTPIELTPAFDVLAKIPLSPGRLPTPLKCTPNKALNVVSTGGNSRGLVFYSIEDA